MNQRTAPLTARGQRTRDALLLAARELFETRGYAETTMTQIADAAEVSHGSVYTYFTNKDAVLNALVEELARDVVGELQLTSDDPDDIVARLELSNRRYLNAYEKNARLLAVVEHAATKDQRYRTLLEDLRASFVERAVKSLRRLQRRGDADRALDARIAGEALCGMVESYARRETQAGRPVTDPVTLATLNRLWAQAVGLTAAKGEPR